MSTLKISEQLKQYRIMNHLTQQQVAEYLNIAVSAYNHYESGARVPGAEKLAALAKLYKLEDQILGVYRKEVITASKLHTFSISDLLNALSTETASKYSLQSNRLAKRIS